MKFGKIQIEGGHLNYTRHMMINSLPCEDILWAYMRRESADESAVKQVISNYLVVVTRRKKRYKFDMTEREVQECIRILKMLNPAMAVGYPKGGRIHLQSLPNTRDLGALTTDGGLHIIPRKLLRSGDLYHLSMSDKEILADEYNLKTVVDFRTEAERRERPDTIMAGVEYYHIPIFDEDGVGLSREKKDVRAFMENTENAQDFMQKQYETIIRDQYSIKQYAKFLDLILHHKDGAILWHCSMGKDRAGVGTILLLSALGVPEDTIREDYLRTNRYLEGDRRYMERLMETKGAVGAEMEQKLDILFQVKESYIDAVFRVIREEYGSMDKFLRKGLYLTPKAKEELCDKYLL